MLKLVKEFDPVLCFVLLTNDSTYYMPYFGWRLYLYQRLCQTYDVIGKKMDFWKHKFRKNLVFYKIIKSMISLCTLFLDWEICVMIADIKTVRKRMSLYKWPLYDLFWPFFFAICMLIFHKTEVLTVILRCLTVLT